MLSLRDNFRLAAYRLVQFMRMSATQKLCFVAALGFLFDASGRAGDLPLVTWQGQTMGSTYTVKIVDAQLSEQQIEVFKAEVDRQLKEVNRQMSHYQPDSELSQFNRAPANTPFKISPEFARVVRQSLELNRLSYGAFDPTIGPIISLWGFGAQTDVHVVPPDALLREAMSQTGCRHLSVTPSDELVKNLSGLQLNLSAVAKGFGVDEMARVLRTHGLTNFYVSISGEVFTSGRNPKGGKWQVGISAPVLNWRPGDSTVTVLSVSGQAISTSGDYQKFFIDAEGRRWAHIFDPKTGKPVQHSLGSVTVVADNATMADGLATTLYVLGPEAGPRFIETQTNAAALFVVRESGGKFRPIPSSRFADLTGYRP
jgi:FAD:protein FMN transferase